VDAVRNLPVPGERRALPEQIGSGGLAGFNRFDVGSSEEKNGAVMREAIAHSLMAVAFHFGLSEAAHCSADGAS